MEVVEKRTSLGKNKRVIRYFECLLEGIKVVLYFLFAQVTDNLWQGRSM